MFLGPNIFLDETIKKCLKVITSDYLIPQADKGRLQFTLETPIAGLDAFLPLYVLLTRFFSKSCILLSYDDLLKRYEEWSFGDEVYSIFLILPCYGNKNLASATFLRMALWSNERHSLLRQLMLNESQFVRFFLISLSNVYLTFRHATGALMSS